MKQLKKTARDCLKKEGDSASVKAIEGSLKKLFGFKKVPCEDNGYYLEAVIKCKDFHVYITLENLERMSMDIKPTRQFAFNPEYLTIFEGKYNFNLLKKFYHRYESLK
jgi:hypothetical protein